MDQQDEDRLPPRQDDPLEDLFNDAMLAQAAKNVKRPRSSDPSMRNALDAATKRMRELYTLPENWEARRGIALIDKSSMTLIGNFREYVHRSLSGTRKLLREHAPIPIDATELCEGYIGIELEQRIRGRSWTEQHSVTLDIWFDEMMIGAPGVKLTVYLHLGVMQKVVLEADTQLASVAGATMMVLPIGTDILWHLSFDTKAAVRKAVHP